MLTVGQLIAIGGAALLSTFGFLLKNMISRIREDQRNLEHDNNIIRGEMTNIRFNYLDRFERLNKNLMETKVEIINEIHKLDLKIK